MTVDIFSDIRCPFCYVGKKKFEKALDKFAKRDDIKLVWHSYQLDPYLQTQQTAILMIFSQSLKASTFIRQK